MATKTLVDPYQYLLGKVSTNVFSFETKMIVEILYQYLLGKVST